MAAYWINTVLVLTAASLSSVPPSSRGEEVVGTRSFHPYADKAARTVLEESVNTESTRTEYKSGDEHALLAVSIALELSKKAGIRVPVRTVKGLRYPRVLGHHELHIPAQGMGRFTRDETYFVLAHELAHIKYQHASKRAHHAALGCDADLSQEGLLKCTALNFSQIVPEDARLSKWHELEADAWAVRFISKHGFPDASEAVIRKIETSTGQDGGMTHPSTTERFEHLRLVKTKPAK